MQFQINILQVDMISKTTKTGNSYFQIEVSYKELGTGKVASKKIMPFGITAATHKTLMDAKSGETYSVTAEKGAPGADGKQYWEWVSASQGAPGSAAPASQPTASQGAQQAAPARAWQGETAEERAAKQVLIVKQSSLSAAAATLAAGAKAAVDPENVIKVAQLYTDFVFGNKEKNLFDAPDDLDDVPV